MLAATSSRDNWERLVAAVLKRDQIWHLCHQDSITTISSSDFSQRLLSFSSTSLRHVSSSPSPVTNVEDRKNPSETITQKLLSALLRRRKPPKVYDPGEEDHFGVESFSLHELLVATDNFRNKNILGHGRCSTIYKGRSVNGSLVVIKRFRAPIDQEKINNELEISSNLVAHRNVLHLRGLCVTQKEQLFVYPYMANGSVASWLRERSESQAPLSWAIRQRIALGAAKSLAYMHHECMRGIIHRDIKAANILLDEGFEAVVADFSLAKFDDGYNNTGVCGTIGHIAPEYLAMGKCSVKADVYGYGIFLLELLTGQRAFDPVRAANYEDSMLLDWVRKLFNSKRFEVMVDQDLEGNFVEEDMEKLFQIALICTRSDPEGRPTMPEVVRMLEDGDDLAERWQDLSHNVCEIDQNYYSGEGLVGISENHFGVESFSLHELLVATNHFSNKNILGHGGHSTVYKGRLEGGSLVAIKRFRAQTNQVMINSELEISSSLVAHPNVLHLRGLCFTQTEQLFVYPCMANGSVASWLRERSESQAPLSWEIRQRIALGAAKGLAYMHHECVRAIIHRDIKAANILLDEGFEAVVADFSLAIFDDGYKTRVSGTPGHIAPEYHATGKCSKKTDVYGYGIFLLELVTGQRAFDLGRADNYEDPVLLDWVRKLFSRKSLEVVADQDLEGNFAEEDMEKLLQIALICAESDPERRPTMPEVVRMLEDGGGLAGRLQDLSQNAVSENVQSYYSAEWIIDETKAWADELSGPR